MMKSKQLTKEQKIELLKKYLIVDEYTKAIIETLDSKKLDEWINVNMDTLLAREK